MNLTSHTTNALNGAPAFVAQLILFITLPYEKHIEVIPGVEWDVTPAAKRPAR